MAYIIKSDDCTSCGVCVDSCPSDAISEKGDVHWIDPAKCTDCGVCEPECPTGAIAQG